MDLCAEGFVGGADLHLINVIKHLMSKIVSMMDVNVT